ncbi:PREDICTED: protein HEXIM1-like [Polistes canadensis]|uniref:protein HEXIM1-like n=1 Tax=Polistes canadensis TaxID=91411 RepID=UPI000718CE51|nr:PREDICTED: protein HEXIM1-like [Polistes canadensis]
MSTCATVNRPILVNITNMEDQNLEKATDAIQEIGVHDAKGVKEVSTPATSSLLSSRQVSRSIGENADSKPRYNVKNWPKSLLRKSGKFESGSGSGEQDVGMQEDGLDVVTKKKKTRRGKSKHKKLKPYLKQLACFQRKPCCRSMGKVLKISRQIRAPYNTTQFLMNDHSDLPDIDQKLSIATSTDFGVTTFQKPPPPRTRDSSFSVDSDEDYFFSSPEDEEEFLSKNFSSAYEDLHAERLSTLSKSELLEEYLQLEAKVDLLTKRLRGKNINQTEEKDNIDDKNNGANIIELDIAKKLNIFQQRIDDLVKQNEELKKDNEALRAQRNDSSASSIDSESDSDSTSIGNRSICSSFKNPDSSPERVPCSCRNISDKNSSSGCIFDSKSDCSDIIRCKTPLSPIVLTKRHVIINEMDGLPI